MVPEHAYTYRKPETNVETVAAGCSLFRKGVIINTLMNSPRPRLSASLPTNGQNLLGLPFFVGP